MPLLAVRNITMAFGGPPLLDSAQLSIEVGERICLIGRNGEGKSTLLNILSGDLKPDEGQFERMPGLRVASLSQAVPEFLPGTVFENVIAGVGETAALLQCYHDLSLKLDKSDNSLNATLEQLSDVQHELETRGGWEIEQRVEQVLTRLGLDPDMPFNNLSGGLKRRVLLGRALVCDPDLLLLDEPTNHLDLESIAWLERFLPSLKVALLFVTHDRIFLKNVATRIVELDRGQLVNFDCGYDKYLERKASMLEAEDKQNEVFDKKLAQEEAWIRQGIKARRTRNEGRVRQLQGMRRERSQRREVREGPSFSLQDGGLSGRKVVTVKGLSYRWGELMIADQFSTTIWRGDKIGVIGRNGSGKTTLLKLFFGQLEPDEGAVVAGTNLKIAYYDQHRSPLKPEMTVKEAVLDDGEYVTVGGVKRHIYAYLSDFLFTPDRAQSQVASLSGGERNRLLLARLFTREANVLILDEPTNDLDLETLELLEDRLVDFPGTVILVSHDREFLNRVVTYTLAMEGEGVVKETVGGYDDYFREKEREAQVVREKLEAEKREHERQRQREREEKKASQPRKLTYKEKKELERLPRDIEQLEEEQAGLVEKMSQPDFGSGGSDEVKSVTERLREIETDLEQKYGRWEELESLE